MYKILLIYLLFFSTSVIQAQYEHEDYIIDKYKKVAKTGDVDAQLKLAQMYHTGDEIDYTYRNTQAVYWYKQAAEQGNAEAQFQLGEIYSDYKQGIGQDYKQAISWYEKAANQGHIQAQLKLAQIYTDGIRVAKVERNDKISFYWYTQVAEYNITKKDSEKDQYSVAEARYRLALRYNLGSEGVTQNYELAISWYEKAAYQRHSQAQRELSDMYKEGKGGSQNLVMAYIWRYIADSWRSHQENLDEIASLLSESQLVEAQLQLAKMYRDGAGTHPNPKKAISLYEELAQQENITAQFQLADMYFKLEGVEENEDDSEWDLSEKFHASYRKAFQLYGELAQQGYTEAQYQLAWMYLHSRYNYSDFRKALPWFEKLAKQGHTNAQYELATMYFDGFGMEQKNPDTGMYWLKQAAEQGNAEAQLLLSEIYYQKDNTKVRVDQNLEKAFYWLEKAAEQGNAEAQFHLAEIYFNGGEGVEQNYKLSFSWCEKAAYQKHKDAQLMLSHMYFKGLGVTKNLVLAYAWTIVASDSYERDKIAQLLSPEQISEGIEFSKELFQKIKIHK